MTIMKMMVRATSRICRAISLGVFLREAPSTRAIILSRKDSPGLEVMRIFSQSDTTLVPPVTEAKSPPDSRSTGADSPVMADSSTLAVPSMTSPSLGMISPALTMTTSPFFSSLEETTVSVPSALSRRALVSFWVFFRLSAWALPRPSATASAKLAKRTVTKRMTQTKMLYRRTLLMPSVGPKSSGKMESSRAMTKPISTTNMTGLCIIYLGFSLVNAPITEDLKMSFVTNLVRCLSFIGNP